LEVELTKTIADGFECAFPIEQRIKGVD
jgi:hypothetical protein